MYDEIWTPVDDNPLKLDLAGCESMWDVHNVLKKTFGFPGYYGRNWSAFWDCLRDFFVGVKEPWEIHVCGYTNLPTDLKERLGRMWIIFSRLEEERPNVKFILKT